MASEKKKKYLTPEGTANYPRLFVPRLPNNPKPDQKPRYSLDLLLPPESQMSDADKARLAALRKICVDAAVAKWGKEKVAPWLKDNKLKLPFKTDISSRGLDDSVFATVIPLWTTKPVGIVSNKAYPPGHEKAGKPIPITDPQDIYSGVVLRASVDAFAYEAEGAKGVLLTLQNVQKIRDGERLDGATNAEDDFEATEVADASDLAGLVADASSGDGGDTSDSDELAALLG